MSFCNFSDMAVPTCCAMLCYFVSWWLNFNGFEDSIDNAVVNHKEFVMELGTESDQQVKRNMKNDDGVSF